MEIHGLVVLHCTEGSSDKVWGWFLDENRKVIKYWGKRTASKYSTMGSSLAEIASDKNRKLKGDYVPLNSIENSTSRAVRRTLHKQYGMAPPITTTGPPNKEDLEKSVVTGKEMETPIKPSEVHRTFEANNLIAFYDRNQSLLGTRPALQRDTIFNHMKKTKEEVHSGGPGESIWTDK